MLLYLKNEQRNHLCLLSERSPEEVIELCKSAFEYLTNGPNTLRYEFLAKRYATSSLKVQQAVEALIALLINATKANASELDLKCLQDDLGLSVDALEILTQFITSKRQFVEGSINSANIRAYRLVNLEWRLEVRVASRCLMRQSNISVTMKLYLHTEPKNENRGLLEEGQQQVVNPDERRNRKDLIVQTDIPSLLNIIQILEDALIESKTRRIRNIVSAIH